MRSHMDKGGHHGNDWAVSVIRDEEAEEWEKDVCQLMVVFGDDVTVMHNFTLDEMDEFIIMMQNDIAKMLNIPKNFIEDAKENQKC